MNAITNVWINEKNNHLVDSQTGQDLMTKISDKTLELLEQNEQVNYIMGLIEIELEDLLLAVGMAKDEAFIGKTNEAYAQMSSDLRKCESN